MDIIYRIFLNNDVLKSQVKDTQISMTYVAWGKVVGISSQGLVIFGENITTPKGFHKIKVYRESLKNPMAKINKFIIHNNL